MKKVLLLFVLCWMLNSAFAQETVTIESVNFHNNHKYKSDFLARFVFNKEGTVLDSNILEQDVKRLLNLHAIRECVYRIDSGSASDEVKVTFELVESHTILSIFNLGLSKENKWFRGGVSEYNFLGKEVTLLGYYQYNNSMHSLVIKSKTPYFKGIKWGLIGNVTLWRDEEKFVVEGESYYYDYQTMKFEVGTIRNLNLQNHIAFQAAYLQEDFEAQDSSVARVNVADRKTGILKGIHDFDATFYDHEYVQGIANVFNGQVFTRQVDGAPFMLFFNETRLYQRWNKSNLAMRLKVGMSTNAEDPYAPFVLDSYINIRGVGNKIDRGTAVVTLNTEWRQSVFNNNFGAIQLVGFGDWGTWRKPGGAIEDFADPNNIEFFVGGGVRLVCHWAYGAVVRVDYGQNTTDASHRGVVLGIGQFF